MNSHLPHWAQGRATAGLVWAGVSAFLITLAFITSPVWVPLGLILGIPAIVILTIPVMRALDAPVPRPKDSKE